MLILLLILSFLMSDNGGNMSLGDSETIRTVSKPVLRDVV